MAGRGSIERPRPSQLHRRQWEWAGIRAILIRWNNSPPGGVVALDQAFGDQLVALLPKLRRFARSLTGSLEEGDDLVQSACERALQRTDQFQPGSRLDSWMYRIVQTVWIDRMRQKGRLEQGVDPAVLARHPGGDGQRAAA